MGFHLWGLVASAVILLPNLLFFLLPPREMPGALKKEPLPLTILENGGRIACLLLPLVFGREIATRGMDAAALVMIASAALYYACWARYFMGRRRFALLFRPLWRIPVPMAVFPVLYFLFLAIWLKSFLMGAAALVFGLGHILLSFSTYRQTKG